MTTNGMRRVRSLWAKGLTTGIALWVASFSAASGEKPVEAVEKLPTRVRLRPGYLIL